MSAILCFVVIYILLLCISHIFSILETIATYEQLYNICPIKSEVDKIWCDWFHIDRTNHHHIDTGALIILSILLLLTPIFLLIIVADGPELITYFKIGNPYTTIVYNKFLNMPYAKWEFDEQS